MIHNNDESIEKRQFKKILDQLNVNYSSPHFEKTLIDQSIFHIQKNHATKPKLLFRLLNSIPYPSTGLILISELLIIVGFIFYLNHPYWSDEQTALDLIGQYSLETL
jgi:hypothetical protein